MLRPIRETSDWAFGGIVGGSSWLDGCKVWIKGLGSRNESKFIVSMRCEVGDKSNSPLVGNCCN